MEKREIVIKGIGKASASPDLIVLSMNLEANELEYEKTMQSGTEMLEMLRAAIVSAGHDGKEMKTTRFNINTNYERYQEGSTWKQRFSGYVCTHSLKLEFSLDMELLGTTLARISKCAAAPSFDIKFSIKDPSAVSEQLLESAIENAKWKASVLTKASGVTLGAINRIDYNWSDVHLYSNTDYMLCEAAADYGSAAPKMMDIEPEDINVSDTVTVAWAIE
jgi:uncharacterized protein YggE